MLGISDCALRIDTGLGSILTLLAECELVSALARLRFAFVLALGADVLEQALNSNVASKTAPNPAIREVIFIHFT